MFQSGRWNEEVPLQVYATWGKEYKKSKDQTLRYMFKQFSLLPHVVIAVVALILYFLF